MSLMEVMVGAVLVVVFLGAMLSLTVRQGSQRQLHHEMSLAIAAAIDNLEHVRSVPFITVPTLDGSGFDVPGSNGLAGGLKAQAGDADGLPGQLHVEIASSSGAYKLYRVTATVSWSGVNGNRTISLRTLLEDRK